MDELQAFEVVRWGFSIAVPATAGLLGVVIGAWLTSRREKVQRRLGFIERQLKGLYSPLLGIRKEIELRSELRVRIHDATGAAWRDLCEDARGRGGVDALQELSDKRGPVFKGLIEYDNTQFRQELMPAYRKMVTTFRDNLWLAERETQAYLGPLIEFVDLWDRWISDSRACRGH